LSNNELPENNVEDPVVSNSNQEITAEEPLAITEEPVVNNESATNENDYASKHATKLAEIDEEDSYKSFVKKAEVHYEWAKDTETEIAVKKVELSAATEEDKNGIENEIAVLENNLLEQQEFASLYESQAETMKPEIDEEDPLVNNEDPIANIEQSETSTEETAETVVDPVVSYEEPDNSTTIENVTTSIAPSNIDEIPEVLNTSIFTMNNNQAAYSDTKRIPVSPKMPEGLVFKVQIGAFRNPIPQAHFKGFAPIMAEDAGNGITRYTAGLFKTFNMANEAKKAIRDIGYSDAFVVGFYNGKRISMNEARAMLAETNNTGEEDFAINNSSNNITATNETNNVVTTEPIVTEEVKDGVSTDVRNIDGVFYAIQVGVYSKPVTAGQLNNVSPLNSERTAGGLIRYTSGVYKTLAEANVAKERIRGLGITDAFVVAYNGGRKIKVAEATSLLGSGNTTSAVTENQTEGTSNSTNTEVNTLDEETPTENSSNENVTPDVNDNLNLTTEDNITPEKTFKNDVPGYEPKENLNLEFRVKLGEYEEDVPVEDAGMFLKLTGRGIKNYEKEGKTVYTLGSFSNYESALDLQIEMKEMGVSKPETIVFREGVEISLETALELMKSNQ
ncbi:MAG: SPOR domain-containing protein, partial [Flavobacteriales bacterium]|nr:SPOR domain-containing protein [Flavobacteriales bacterium]